jgi:hypothetical protein
MSTTAVEWYESMFYMSHVDVDVDVLASLFWHIFKLGSHVQRKAYLHVTVVLTQKHKTIFTIAFFLVLVSHKIIFNTFENGPIFWTFEHCLTSFIFLHSDMDKDGLSRRFQLVTEFFTR